MKKDLNKTNKIRLAMIIIFLVVSIGITIFLVPFIKCLLTADGRALIEQKVKDFGIFAPVIFVLFQILQIVVALIPGEPVEIMGGIMFGSIGGLILCLIGILAGTIIVYYMVRRIGKPLADVFISEEKLKKLSFLKNEKKLELLVFILFLIPGTPKDTLTYFVPLTEIKPLKFFILATLARIPSVVSSTMVGQSLGKGNMITGIIIFIITAVVVIVGILININITGSK